MLSDAHDEPRLTDFGLAKHLDDSQHSTINFQLTLTGEVISNSAQSGGGAAGGSINGCTLTGNQAAYSGGGVWYSTLNNCIIYFNNAMNGANWGGINVTQVSNLPALNRYMGGITLPAPERA